MTLNLIFALMLTASRSSTHAVFRSTSAINKPVAAINAQPPTSNVAVGASPAASVFAGSASIPAPTVVPATNAALPMTVPGASSASAAASFILESRESCGRGDGVRGFETRESCGRGGAVKGFAGFGTAVMSQSMRLCIVSNSNHSSVTRYGYSRWKMCWRNAVSIDSALGAHE